MQSAPAHFTITMAFLSCADPFRPLLQPARPNFNFGRLVCGVDASPLDTPVDSNPDNIDDRVDLICVAPKGAAILGETCALNSDCRSGMCLSSIGFNGVACTSNANCNTAGGEECLCPVTNPNCITGKECAVVDSFCTVICDQNSDCSGGAVGNTLTTCAPTTYAQTPSGSAVPISTCAP